MKCDQSLEEEIRKIIKKRPLQSKKTISELTEQFSLSKEQVEYIFYRKPRITPEKIKEYARRQKTKPYYYLISKLRTFNNSGINLFNKEYSIEDVIGYFGPNPVCYLTGDPIDFQDPKTFSLDHFVPKSKGGDNSLSNMKLCSPKANYMKRDMPLEEFIKECKKVLSYYNKVKQNQVFKK